MKSKKKNWQVAIKNFREIELRRGDKKVWWEWIGEGLEGDFNPVNPDDVPLLRFSCSEFYETPKGWEDMRDASYCTQLPISTPMRNLIEAAGIIMEAIQDVNYKHRLEQLSWLNPRDFK